MRRLARKLLLGACLATSTGAVAARAEPPDAAPAPPKAPAPPTAPSCGPPAIGKHAALSDTGSYIGYYVGGGALYYGESRYPFEGTWGWDYSGWCFPRRIMLLWSHGRLYQGGTGAYKSEGPHLLHHHEGKESEDGH